MSNYTYIALGQHILGSGQGLGRLPWRHQKFAHDDKHW